MKARATSCVGLTVGALTPDPLLIVTRTISCSATSVGALTLDPLLIVVPVVVTAPGATVGAETPLPLTTVPPVTVTAPGTTVGADTPLPLATVVPVIACALSDTVGALTPDPLAIVPPSIVWNKSGLLTLFTQIVPPVSQTKMEPSTHLGRPELDLTGSCRLHVGRITGRPRRAIIGGLGEVNLRRGPEHFSSVTLTDIPNVDIVSDLVEENCGVVVIVNIRRDGGQRRHAGNGAAVVGNIKDLVRGGGVISQIDSRKNQMTVAVANHSIIPICK